MRTSAVREHRQRENGRNQQTTALQTKTQVNLLPPQIKRARHTGPLPTPSDPAQSPPPPSLLFPPATSPSSPLWPSTHLVEDLVEPVDALHLRVGVPGG